MSKLHLINEISTAVKMASGNEHDQIKLMHYLDDLLSSYEVKEKEIDDIQDDNEDYIHMYITAREIENYSNETLRNYRYELNRFATFINKSLLKATTGDVRQYLAAHAHLMQSTITSKMEKLSAFYGWLVVEEELIKNPVAKLNRPKLPKKVREGLTVVELEKVRAACEDIRQRALIELFYSTGCRLSELIKLNIGDIDWMNSSVIVHGKGDKERRVYLSEKATFYLEQYLESRDDECPALIVSTNHPVSRLTGGGIRYVIKKIQKRSSIDRELYPHLMRHTFAQLSLNAGMELADLQALMGHEKADTTLRYANVSEDRKQAAFKKFHMQ